MPADFSAGFIYWYYEIKYDIILLWYKIYLECDYYEETDCNNDIDYNISIYNYEYFNYK